MIAQDISKHIHSQTGLAFNLYPFKLKQNDKETKQVPTFVDKSGVFELTQEGLEKDLIARAEIKSRIDQLSLLDPEV